MDLDRNSTGHTNLWFLGIVMQIEIYVDGSEMNSSVGYGAVVLRDGDVVEELHGTVPDSLVQGTRQIAGELFAVIKAIEWCQENSVSEVTLCYDYTGIERWVSGDWKAKHPLTQNYASLIRNSGIKVKWRKIDSHTGDIWNDRADELAKKDLVSAPKEPIHELESEASGFVQFLNDHGYKAEFKGIYNSNCAKIEVSENGKKIGYINIYQTKKAITPKYHELKMPYECKFDLIWQDYYYKQCQLPIDTQK